MFDFEIAAINAAIGIFPNVEVSGYCYHLSANIWKHIQEYGLKERYINDQVFSLHIRMVADLAFIPPNDVIAAFDELCDMMRNDYHHEVDHLLDYHNEVDHLLDYFEDNYISRFRRNAHVLTLCFPTAMEYVSWRNVTDK